MKKFRYRLQPVLKLRQQQEQQKKRAVGILIAQINEQQQQALAFQKILLQEGQKVRQLYVQEHVDVDWISHYRRYVMSVHQAIKHRIDNVARIQQRLAQARQELSQAAKQTKILEKLREKKKKRFDWERKRAENYQQDEITANLLRKSPNERPLAVS